MPPPRYSPVVTGPVSVAYGIRAMRFSVLVSTAATPSAVATLAGPPPPSARPEGAAPTVTEPRSAAAPRREGSTKVTVSAPKSATSRVPLVVCAGPAAAGVLLGCGEVGADADGAAWAVASLF